VVVVSLEAGSKAGNNSALLPAIERASGQASELALLGERLVKIECQSHSELPILEISGSDSVRRAREACGLLSAAQFLSQLLCRTLETGHGSQTDGLTEYFTKLSSMRKFNQPRRNHFGVRLNGQIENLSQFEQLMGN
jgi:hypothetical protein